MIVALVVVGACARGAPPATAPTSASTAPALPTLEVQCAADADCALANLALAGDDTCCPVCGQQTPGRVDWVRAVRDTCAARPDWTERCAPLSCPVGIERAVCKDQRCVAAP